MTPSVDFKWDEVFVKSVICTQSSRVELIGGFALSEKLSARAHPIGFLDVPHIQSISRPSKVLRVMRSDHQQHNISQRRERGFSPGIDRLVFRVTGLCGAAALWGLSSLDQAIRHSHSRQRTDQSFLKGCFVKFKWLCPKNSG